MLKRSLLPVLVVILLVLTGIPLDVCQVGVVAETTTPFEIESYAISDEGDLDFVILAHSTISTLTVSNNATFPIRIDGTPKTTVSIPAGENVTVSFTPTPSAQSSRLVQFTFRGGDPPTTVIRSLRFVSDENLLSLKEGIESVRGSSSATTRYLAYDISRPDDTFYCKYHINLGGSIQTNEGLVSDAYVQLGVDRQDPREIRSASVSLDPNVMIKFPSDQRDILIKVIYVTIFIHQLFVHYYDFQDLFAAVNSWYADVTDLFKGIAGSFFNGVVIFAHQTGRVASSLISNPGGGAWGAVGVAAEGIFTDFSTILDKDEELRGTLDDISGRRVTDHLFSSSPREGLFGDDATEIAYQLKLARDFLSEDFDLQLGDHGQYTVSDGLTLEEIEDDIRDIIKDLSSAKEVIVNRLVNILEEEVLEPLYEGVVAYYLSMTAVGYASDLGKKLDIWLESYHNSARHTQPYNLGTFLDLTNTWMAFNWICSILLNFINQHISVLNRPQEWKDYWMAEYEIARNAVFLPFQWYTQAVGLIDKFAEFQISSTVLLESSSYLVYGYERRNEIEMLPKLRAALGFDQIYIETDDSNLQKGEAIGYSTVMRAIDEGFNLTLLSMGGPAVNVLSRYINEDFGREFGVQFKYDDQAAVWEIEDRGATPGGTIRSWREDSSYDYAMVGILHIDGSKVGLAAGISSMGTTEVCERLADHDPDIFSTTNDHIYVFKVPKSGGAPTEILHRSGPPMPRLPGGNSRGFMDSGIDPSRGLSSTQFTFGTMYIDATGEAPAELYVKIGSNRYPMTRISPASANVRLGLRYEAQVSGFERGSHQFRFYALDSEGGTLERSSYFSFHVGQAFKAPTPELWVRIDSPLEGAWVYGMAEISIRGGDFSEGPVNLYYCIDDEPFTKVTGPLKVNTKRFSNGTHTLTAQVRGGENKYRETSLDFIIDNPSVKHPKLGFISGVHYSYLVNAIELEFIAVNLGEDGYLNYSCRIDKTDQGPYSRYMRYREEFKMVVTAPFSTKDEPLLLEVFDEYAGKHESVWSAIIMVPSETDASSRVFFDKPAYFMGDVVTATFIIDSNYQPQSVSTTASFQLAWGLHHSKSFNQLQLSPGQYWSYSYSTIAVNPGPILVWGFVGALGDKNSSNNEAFESVNVYPAGRATVLVETFSPANLVPGGETGEMPEARSGVDVLLDGIKRGTTNDRGTAILNPSPGTHTVSVAYDSTSMSRTVTISNDDLISLVFFSPIPDLGTPPHLSLVSLQNPSAENETLKITLDISPSADGDPFLEPTGRIFGEPLSYAGWRYDLAFRWMTVERVSEKRRVVTIDTSRLPEGEYTAWLSINDAHVVNDPTLRGYYESYLNNTYSILFISGIVVHHEPKCDIMNLFDLQRVSGTIRASVDTGTVDPNRSTLLMKFGSDEWKPFSCTRTFGMTDVTIDTTTLVDGLHTLAFVLIKDDGGNATAAVRLLVCNDEWRLIIRSPEWISRGLSTLNANVLDNLGFPVNAVTVELTNGDWSQIGTTDENGTVLFDAHNLGPYEVVASFSGMEGGKSNGVVLERVPSPALITAYLIPESGSNELDGSISLLFNGNLYESCLAGSNLTCTFSVPASMFIEEDFSIPGLHATIEVTLDDISQNLSFILIEGALKLLEIKVYDLPPTTPSGVSAAVSSTFDALITWDTNVDEDFSRYEVLLGMPNDTEPTTYSTMVTEPDQNRTMCTISGLLRGQNYSIVVRVVDTFGREASSQPVLLSIPAMGRDCTIGITLTEVGNTWAEVSWNVTSSDVPIHCILYLSTDNSSLGTPYGDTYALDIDHANITGLTPSMEYVIHLMVFFDELQKVVSEPFSITTIEPDEPPVEPPIIEIALTVSCYLRESIIICDMSWNQVEVSEFEAFIVMFKRVDSPVWSIHEEITSSDDTTSIIEGLLPKQEYEFKIELGLTDGSVFWSNTVKVETPEVVQPPESSPPERPRIIEVAEIDGEKVPSIMVRWDWDMEGSFVRFDLYLSHHAGELGTLQWSSTVPTERSARISNLEQGTDYFITVRVGLSDGSWLDSPQAHVKTKEIETSEEDAPLGLFTPMLSLTFAYMLFWIAQVSSKNGRNRRRDLIDQT